MSEPAVEFDPSMEWTERERFQAISLIAKRIMARGALASAAEVFQRADVIRVLCDYSPAFLEYNREQIIDCIKK